VEGVNALMGIIGGVVEHLCGPEGYI